MRLLIFYRNKVFKNQRGDNRFYENVKFVIGCSDFSLLHNRIYRKIFEENALSICLGNVRDSLSIDNPFSTI